MKRNFYYNMFVVTILPNFDPIYILGQITVHPFDHLKHLNNLKSLGLYKYNVEKFQPVYLIICPLDYCAPVPVPDIICTIILIPFRLDA